MAGAEVTGPAQRSQAGDRDSLGCDPRPVHAAAADDVLDRLDTDRDRGLGADEVRARQERYGPNALRPSHQRGPARILLDQFRSIVIGLLAVAATAAFATGRLPEGIALVAVIGVNTLIGFASEWRAVRSMEALRALGARTARVRRNGHERTVPVDRLVPGDIVIVGAEDLVPADLRLLPGGWLRVSEAALTGESVPVDKEPSPMPAEAPLAERSNLLFKGTTVTEGRADGVVVTTGADTELGRVATLTEQAEGELTPLEQRLDRLGRRLAWATVGIAVVVAAAGLATGRDALLMIETAIALGVAAIPEGLPIVATLALARGMSLMARRNALVNRLSAVETLGATGVILADKTGTLTENRMTLRRATTPLDDHDLTPEARSADAADPMARDPVFQRLLEVAALCNDAELGDSTEDRHGDPTEVALLEGAADWGIDRAALLRERPEVRDQPFDPEVMMMATFHRSGDGIEVAVKGAPRAVLAACTTVAGKEGDGTLGGSDRRTWHERAERLAADGLRVLALADRVADREDEAPYERLRLLGLVGLADPPRDDVADAIAECRRAGVRTVIVTGDQASTAGAIAHELGLAAPGEPPPITGADLPDSEHISGEERSQILQTSVFARVSPEQKLNLVRLFQAGGEVIAMTGDGVNDAPGLKKADIGVAMGRRGTDAARQAADMVLRDDRFATIMAAIRHGRTIFANIRKSVMFMLCTNFAEVLVVALASLAQAPLPLRPLQILYLNVLTDVFPALALGVGAGSAVVMRQPPRPAGEGILTRHHWLAIAAWSAVLGACVLVAMVVALTALGFDEQRAVTVSFLTLAFGKLWFVLNLRGRGAGPMDNDIVRNPWMGGALLICIPLLLAAVYWTPLAGVLDTADPGTAGWLLILGASLTPAVIGLVVPGIRFHTGTSSST